MSAIISEWITKAEGDFRTAGRELAVKDGANFDAVCFHAQQCIEKLMKSYLIVLEAQPPRTHDLVFLSDRITDRNDAWFWPREELRFLSRAAVAFRYPGESSEPEDAAEAFDICSRLRESLLKLIASFK